MRMIQVKPALYRKVRDPISNEVLKEDQVTSVMSSSYWLRRIRLGDVIEVVADTAPQKRTPRRKQSQLQEGEE